MLIGNGRLRGCVEETMRKVRVRVRFGGGDAVNLGDVAGGEFLDATVVSSDAESSKAVLLGERNLGGQFLGFINLAQLRQDVDLLNRDGQQLGLLLLFAEV
jgi:hypothetical protein